MSKLDFLSIGDMTTDAFIKLQDAHVHCRIDTTACELCLPFADKVPYDSVEVVRAVGNAPNAAVSATRLGLQTALVTNVGDDQNGKECMEALKKEGVDTRYARVHVGAETNYHYVLWFNSERTILIKHQLYEYRLPSIEETPRWVYLSSFRGTEEYHVALADYLEKNPEIKVTFQPGKFEINLGFERLKRLYARSEFFSVNVEEAQKILDSTAEPRELLRGLHALGPKLVAITDGPKGAYFFDGSDAYFMPPYPDPKPPFERTGAGDAFASTFTVALALGKTPLESLRWAPINSAYVVQEVGAQKGLLSREKLEHYLSEAPTDYFPKKLERVPATASA